jgi:sugar lactone lactonase YvrE
MRRWVSIAAVMAVAMALAPSQALASDVGVVRNFGPSLVAACPFPEGIARDPAGNLYASSDSGTASANICVIDSGGKLRRKISVAAGPSGVVALTGELFTPGRGLYVLDQADDVFGDGRLMRMNPATGSVTVLSTKFAFPNGMAQDLAGNLFVADSVTDTITKVAPDGSSSVIWKQDPLFTTNGFPPIGANDLAFDLGQRYLYVTNSGDHRVLRVPVEPGGSAGAVQIFADGATIDAAQHTTDALNAPDGIMFDVRGNLYVCANVTNQIQVLDPAGHLVARYSGTGANALDFPASLVFAGRTLYLTDLSNFDGGVNSKLSVLHTPFPGLPPS